MKTHVSRQLDWLTLSCMTMHGILASELKDYVLKVLRLDCFSDEFVRVGRDRFYEHVYRFNDISVLVCKDDIKKLLNQGVCVRFSSNGLAFYQEHLKTLGTDLRTIFKTWRSIACDGYFTRCSRIDYALDDKILEDSDDIPFITMHRIRESAKRGEFRTRLSRGREPQKLKVDVSLDTSRRNFDETGNTVYFGKRKGGQVLIRFYDKLMEQREEHRDVMGIKSWTRCEFEFHDARAMAVFNAFCDKSPEEFAEYMSEVINNYIQFIYIDDSNRSRCSAKRWWSQFVGTVHKVGLIIPPFVAATFSATEKWLERSVFPTLARYIQCIGMVRFLDKLRKFIRAKITPRQKQLMNDFKTVWKGASKIMSHSTRTDPKYTDYITKRGLNPWIYTGEVSASDIKADFQEFADWSPDELLTDGFQLTLDSFIDEIAGRKRLGLE